MKQGQPTTPQDPPDRAAAASMPFGIGTKSSGRTFLPVERKLPRNGNVVRSSLFVLVCVHAAVGACLGLFLFLVLLAGNSAVRDGIVTAPHPREMLIVLAAALVSMCAVGSGLTGFLLLGAAER